MSVSMRFSQGNERPRRVSPRLTKITARSKPNTRPFQAKIPPTSHTIPRPQYLPKYTLPSPPPSPTSLLAQIRTWTVSSYIPLSIMALQTSLRSRPSAPMLPLERFDNLASRTCHILYWQRWSPHQAAHFLWCRTDFMGVRVTT